MTPETEALVLQMLQAMDAKLDQIMQSIEEMNRTIDRIELLMDRMARQLPAGEGV